MATTSSIPGRPFPQGSWCGFLPLGFGVSSGMLKPEEIPPLVELGGLVSFQHGNA